jgi:hypothetical protein
MEDTMHDDNLTPCCGEEPDVEREMTDMGDHGGHAVYRETVDYVCPACGSTYEERDLVSYWDEEVAA